MANQEEQVEVGAPPWPRDPSGPPGSGDSPEATRSNPEESDAAARMMQQRALVGALIEKTSSEISNSANSLQQAVRELINRDDDYALRVQQLGEIRQLLGLSLRESHSQVIMSIVKLGLAAARIAARVDLSAVPERYRSSVEREQTR